MAFRHAAPAFVLALCSLSACGGGGGGGGGGTPDPTTGSLAVTVAGLPSGADAATSVTGPGGYAKAVTATTTLTGLTPGTYTVAAQPVTSVGDGFGPTVTGSPATVVAGQTASATVSYAPTTGRLAVSVTGLPAGGTGDVTVSGPAAFSQHLGASAVLTGLAPGSYAVASAPVSVVGQAYAGAVSGSPAAVSAGATANATVAYAVAAAGQLTVTVSGGITPVEANAHVSVTGPNGFSAVVSTSPKTFTNLPAGAYSVTATDFTSAVSGWPVAFTGHVTGSPAAVAGGVDAQVTVTFLPPAPAITQLTPSFGDFTAAGASMTVQGKDFTPGMTVAVDGDPATVQLALSSTVVSVKLPAVKPGAHQVAVTTPGGTSAAGATSALRSYHWTGTPVPGGGSAGAVVAGPDGNMWFSERAKGKVGKVTPAGAVTEYDVPKGGALSDVVADPWDLAVGPDGNLWFTDYDSARIGRITPAGVVTMFPNPSGCFGLTITAGPPGDAKMWFGENVCPAGGQDQIGTIDTSDPTKFTTHSFPAVDPDPTRPAGSPYPFPNLFDLQVGSDGKVYWAEYNNLRLGRIDASFAFSIVPATGAHASSNPTWLTLGSDGKIWFVDGKVVEVAADGTFTEHAVTATVAGSVQGRIAADGHGLVWFAGTNTVGSMDEVTHAVDLYTFPLAFLPTGVGAAADGTIWALGQGSGGTSSIFSLQR